MLKIFLSLCFLIAANVILAERRNDWWRHTIIYEVYVRSFKDSDSDGNGDIRGITEKLEYFVDLGVETLWLTPFYDSPMYEGGYDVSNYTFINPMLGTMEDFDELIEKSKKFGLKILMDLVLNHCSVEHEYFQKSVDRIDPYTDYFLWADPKGWNHGIPIPPNNWLQLTGGSAWTWNDKRQQFYYHVFLEQQPDFNMRNPKVIKEIKDIMKFWLDKGVSGFRMDAVLNYVEDEQLRDENYISYETAERHSQNFDDMWHDKTYNQPENKEILHDLREYMDNNYFKKDGFERIMILEIYREMKDLVQYYDLENYKISHFPFYFNFIGMAPYPIAETWNFAIHTMMELKYENATANWVIENHDFVRVGKRYCEEFVDIFAITVFMLPGVAVTYYGSEIGMTDMALRTDQRMDNMPPNGNHEVGFETRDTQRLPMQWDDSLNAGFTDYTKTWLPLNSDYWRRNVKLQNETSISHLQVYKALAELRKTETRKFGKVETYYLSSYVYAYARILYGHETYLVVINLSTETEVVSLKNTEFSDHKLKVLVSSINSEHRKGDVIRKSNKPFMMRPRSAIVLSPLTIKT